MRKLFTKNNVSDIRLDVKFLAGIKISLSYNPFYTPTRISLIRIDSVESNKNTIYFWCDTKSIGMNIMDCANLGKRIKSAREQCGYTQEQLAEIVGLSPMHISVIERGVKPPKLDTFLRIANALKVSADQLLQDELNNIGKTVTTEISMLVQDLPKHEQQLIAHCIQSYIDGCNQFRK